MDKLHNLHHYKAVADIILFGIVQVDLYRLWQVVSEVVEAVVVFA